MHVVATAGHVDHGKSTLVLGLTGMDPDRFEEEKRRGLTIDLGFAWTTLPSGRDVAFVDVPGHVRFLKNMLAGTGAVDACVFVVAATEGWKPQSEEHLRILELLGLQHGLVALTKVDLVDDDEVALARLEVVDRVRGTFLDEAEIVAVDAAGGRGLDDVRSSLDQLLSVTPTAADHDRPRLWVDRSFAATGAGTVVTGTLAGGRLRVDDELELLPAGRRVRVRALQSRGRPEAELAPGSRAAVNLAGIAHGDVARGDALVRPGQWQRTRMIDASLQVLDGLEHDVSRRGAYHAYLGSGEYAVQLRVLGSASLAAGALGAVRLHLPHGLPLVPGDRYVLRESGRRETVGGGEVLDVDPQLPAGRARPDRSIARVVAERGWVDVDDLERLTGQRVAPNLRRWVVDPGALAATTDHLRERLAAAGPVGLDVAELDERERSVLDSMPTVVFSGSRARSADVSDPFRDHPFVVALEGQPFAPPSPDDAGVSRTELRELVRQGLVVEQDGVWFAPTAIARAAEVVAGLLDQHPDGVTVADVRVSLGTTRKWALPMLARLDAMGVTRRRGDVRIAGPRLPRG